MEEVTIWYHKYRKSIETSSWPTCTKNTKFSPTRAINRREYYSDIRICQSQSSVLPRYHLKKFSNSLKKS